MIVWPSFWAGVMVAIALYLVEAVIEGYVRGFIRGWRRRKTAIFVTVSEQIDAQLRAKLDELQASTRAREEWLAQAEETANQQDDRLKRLIDRADLSSDTIRAIRALIDRDIHRHPSQPGGRLPPYNELQGQDEKGEHQ